MAPPDARCNDYDGEEADAEDGVNCNEHRFNELPLEDKVCILVSIVVAVQIVTRADPARVTPSPDLHEDEKDDTNGYVRCEEHVAAPEEHPAFQVETNLRQDGPNEGEE